MFTARNITNRILSSVDRRPSSPKAPRSIFSTAPRACLQPHSLLSRGHLPIIYDTLRSACSLSWPNFHPRRLLRRVHRARPGNLREFGKGHLRSVVMMEELRPVLEVNMMVISRGSFDLRGRRFCGQYGDGGGVADSGVGAVAGVGCYISRGLCLGVLQNCGGGSGKREVAGRGKVDGCGLRAVLEEWKRGVPACGGEAGILDGET